jgi:hypothetical protein
MTKKHKLLVILVLLILVGGSAAAYYLCQPQAAGPVMHTAERERNKDTISVFFPEGPTKLARKTVEFPRQLSDKERAEALFRELKEAKCIPDRLKFHELAVGQDGVLYLNVSKEFMDWSNPGREITMTYGIVNSFAESFKNTKSVQLLVEGEPVYTRSGLLYIFDPIPFNKDLLED